MNAAKALREEAVPVDISAYTGIVLGLFTTRQAAVAHAKDFASCWAKCATLALVFGIEPRNGMFVLTYKGDL